jgi:hypothetical protein
MYARREETLTKIVVLVALTLSAGAQSLPNAASQPSQAPANGSSLAAVVRNSKAQKTAHAKKVVTEENLEPSAGPLPKLKMDGAENADDVMAAIVAYKADHSAAETEDAVRRWYDKYDDELAAAIQANQDIKTLRDANVSNGYELCQQGRDYEKCAKRQRAEQGGARLDQSQIESNNQLMVRIQHSFMKIRNGLNQNGLQYEWFKVRTTNNIDRF